LNFFKIILKLANENQKSHTLKNNHTPKLKMAENSIPNFNAAIAYKRRERDLMKLLMSDYKVTQNKEN